MSNSLDEKEETEPNMSKLSKYALNGAGYNGEVLAVLKNWMREHVHSPKSRC